MIVATAHRHASDFWLAGLAAMVYGPPLIFVAIERRANRKADHD